MNTRRRFLTFLGVGATALAGCNSSGNSASTPINTPTENTTQQGESGGEEKVEENEQTDLSAEQIHENLLYGEDNAVLEEAQNKTSFDAINQALEKGMQQGGRNQAIANAVQTASQEFYAPVNVEGYWKRHQATVGIVNHIKNQKNGENWDFKIDSRLDATPSPNGWMKYSRIDVETENEETEKGNKKYDTIRATLTEDLQHTTHIKGNKAKTNNTIKTILQQIDNPETHYSASLIDKDALEEAIEEDELDEERSYDQVGMGIGIMLGGGIDIRDEGENAVVPEYLLVSEDGREQEILEVVDEYEEDGDMTLRRTMREKYFNEGFDEYEATETDITADASVSMEGIDDFDMSEEVADA